jgi:hypothetical protein
MQKKFGTMFMQHLKNYALAIDWSYVKNFARQKKGFWCKLTITSFT